MVCHYSFAMTWRWPLPGLRLGLGEATAGRGSDSQPHSGVFRPVRDAQPESRGLITRPASSRRQVRFLLHLARPQAPQTGLRSLAKGGLFLGHPRTNLLRLFLFLFSNLLRQTGQPHLYCQWRPANRARGRQRASQSVRLRRY